MITCADDERWFRLQNQELRWAYTAFKRGEYRKAEDIFESQAAQALDVTWETFQNYMFIMRSKAHCYEFPEESDKMVCVYNEQIKQCASLMMWLTENIRQIQETYTYRYGNKFEREPCNTRNLLLTLDRLEGLLCSAKEGHKRHRSTTRDPVAKCSRLPNEILQNIFGYLSTRDLSSALTVSHEWHNSVLLLSRYLQTPVFAPNRSVRDMSNYLRMCRKMSVRECPHITIPDFAAGQENLLLWKLTQSNLKVDELSISSCGNFCCEIFLGPSRFLSNLLSLNVVLSPTAKVDLNPFLHALTALKHLSVRLEFGSRGIQAFEGQIVVRDLDTLELSVHTNHRHSRNTHIEEFLARSSFVNIDKVVLRDVPIGGRQLVRLFSASHPDWIELDGVKVSLRALVKIMKAARVLPSVLQLSGMSSDHTSHFRLVHRSDFSVLHNLRSVQFSSMPLSAATLRDFLDGTGGNLKEVAFTSIGPMVSLTLSDELQKCPLLELLVLVDCSDCDDKMCQSLGKTITSLHRLKKLHLFSDKVTSSGIKSLFAGTPQSLELSIPSNRISPETVAHLEDAGFCSKIESV